MPHATWKRERTLIGEAKVTGRERPAGIDRRFATFVDQSRTNVALLLGGF